MQSRLLVIAVTTPVNIFGMLAIPIVGNASSTSILGMLATSAPVAVGIRIAINYAKIADNFSKKYTRKVTMLDLSQKVSYYARQAAALACAARLTYATHSPKTLFGRLTYIIKFSRIQ